MTTHILLLDNSGSMERMGKEPVDAIKEYINVQKVKNPQDLVSLYLFGTGVSCMYKNIQLKNTPKFDYIANGLTALNDAICTAIDDHINKLNCVCVIVTDGEENNSSRDPFGIISREMIDEKKRDGWKFVYMGANHDVEKVGSSMGIDYCLSYDQESQGDLVSMCKLLSQGV